MSTSLRRIGPLVVLLAPLRIRQLVAVLLGRAQAVDARHRRHDDHVAPGEQRRGGRVAEPVDLVVDRGVLLDVGVGRGDVGLGLVVVVVADEVLDPVVGEELAELVGQLGGERLVGGDDQRGLLHLLDGPGDGGALARAGDAEQRLVALAVGDALGELGDGPRLVAGGLEVGHHLERDALQGHRRSTVPAGCDSESRGRNVSAVVRHRLLRWRWRSVASPGVG